MTDIRSRALGIKREGHTSAPQARLEPAEPPAAPGPEEAPAEPAETPSEPVAEGDSVE